MGRERERERDLLFCSSSDLSVEPLIPQPVVCSDKDIGKRPRLIENDIFCTSA